MSTAEQLLKFIATKLGTTTKLEDDRNAQKQLLMICRHITEEEKFSDFLGRIERLASRLDTGEQGRSYMVKTAFDRNLTPKNREFLIDRDFEAKTPAEIAALLDKTQKFRTKMNVNKVSNNSDEFVELRNQNEDCDQKIGVLQQDMQEVRGNIASILELLKQERHQSETHMVQAVQQKQQQQQHLQQQRQQAYQPQRQNRQLRPEQQQQQRPQQQSKPTLLQQQSLLQPPQPHQQHVRSFPDNQNRQAEWQLNRFGKPIRCFKCGMMGHTAATCLGLCKAICHTCNKVGHLQSVCPQRQRTTKN